MAVAAIILAAGESTRMGRPKASEGRAEATAGPPFATVTGLLHYAVNNKAEAPSAAYCPPEEQAGRRFGRLGQWLRENF